MQFIHRLRALARNVFRRSDVDRDLHDELSSYVDLVADEARAKGKIEDEAERAGRLALGGVGAVTESVRAGRTGARAEQLWQDVRYAMRALRKSPSYSLAVIGTLALSLGVATAVFTLAYGLLWRPFPLARPDEVMALFLTRPATQDFRGEVGGARFAEWRKRNQVFAGMAAATDHRLDLLHDGAVMRVESELVSADFFHVLGISPLRGRVLNAGDVDGRTGVVPAVIAEGLWRRTFGAEPGIVGRSFQASGVTFSIVGVVPEAFARWRQPAEVWAPYALTPTLVEPRVVASDGYLIFEVLGRLRPGVSQAAAQSAMSILDPQIHEAMHGYVEEREGVAVVALRDVTTDQSAKRSFIFLWASALLVVCLAAANIVSLTLTRNMGREQELAMRLALGGGARRVTGQLALEGLLLIGAGAVAALGVEYVVRPILVALAPPASVRGAVISADWRVVGFAVAIAGAMVAILAAAAAIRVRRARLCVAAAAAIRSTLRPRVTRAHAALVLLQSTMAVPVVVAAVLLVVTVARIDAIDLGFNPRGLEVMAVYLPEERYGSEAAVNRITAEVTARARATGSIAGLAVSTTRPLNFFGEAAPLRYGTSIAIEGGRRILNGDPANALLAPGWHNVTPGYFEQLGVPLHAGRDFAESDIGPAPTVAIINETMARQHWPGANPIGKRINFDLGQGRRPPAAPWVEIVGVVGDVRHYRIDGPPRPQIYTPLAQRTGGYPWLYLYARAKGSEAQAAAALRDLVRSVDPRVAVGTPATAEDLMEELTATPRYAASLLGVFGTICLTLAVVGIYGLGALVMSHRRREMGIRMALGATSRDVMRFIAWCGLAPAACGLAIGAIAAALMSQTLAGLLYGVEPSDPVVFAAVALALLAVAATAAYLPARRATKIDPVETLRAE